MRRLSRDASASRAHVVAPPRAGVRCSGPTVGTHVAFFRGINVGGKHSLPMQQVVRLFNAAGCENVRTYIQSGNVVFDAASATVRALPRVIPAAVAERFRFDTPLIVRTARELGAVAKENPFLRRGLDASRAHVAFLASAPSAAQISSLDPERSPGDAFVVRGREVYLQLPNGVGRSKLTNAYLDSTLGTVSTMRNWRTVLALVDLARR